MPVNRLAHQFLALFLALVTCAGGASPLRTRASSAHLAHTTLILDFIPNAVHTGIYHALAASYYARAGLDLTIIQPTSTSDTLRLIAAGKADFGIADGIDVAGQIDQGRDAQAIMALVQRPLVGLIALRASGIASARGFEGQTIGITGVPSDTVAARTIIAHAGGSYGKVRVVTIGFNGVQYLEAGKIAAFTGFWPDDGTQVGHDGFPARYFPLDQNGGPAYPGLVVFSTRARIARDPALMRAFVAATARGYADTLANPARGLADLLALNPTLKRPLTTEVLHAYLPLFRASAARYGDLNPRNLAALSAFLLKNGLIHRPFSAERFGGNRFLP